MDNNKLFKIIGSVTLVGAVLIGLGVWYNKYIDGQLDSLTVDDEDWDEDFFD